MSIVLPANATYQDVEDELIVQETMLESMGDEDHEGQEAIRRTIAELEERLSAFPSDGQIPQQGQDHDTNSFANTPDGSLSDVAPFDMEASLRRVYQQHGQQQQSASAQNGLNQNGSLNGASHGRETRWGDGLGASSYNGRQDNRGMQHNGTQSSFQNSGLNFGQPSMSGQSKRPLEVSPLAADGNRVKRLTPTPSRSHTPLPGISSHRRALALEQQRLHEQRLRIKKETEDRDAAFAASLSQYPQSASNSHSPSMAGPSTTPNRTSQPQWPHIFRPKPTQTPAKQSPSSMNELPPNHNQYNAQASSSSSTPRSVHASSYTLPSIKPEVNGGVKSEYSRPNWPTPGVGTFGQFPPSANAMVKREVKPEYPRANNSTSRSSGPQVVDLTGDDDEDGVQEIIDLTRPTYPMPGSFPGSTAYDNNFVGYNGHRPPTLPSFQNVYNTALAGMSRARDLTSGLANGLTNGFNTDLSQLSYLVNGRDMNPADEMYLRNRLAASLNHDPRDVDADPETTREDLRKLMENIQPEEDDTVVEEDIPVRGMTVNLKPYQMTGLKWLQKMESGSNKGGILADDMGLGKTVQTLALLATNKSDDPMDKTTLILAPVALLRQWQEEIHNKIKPGQHRLNVFLHHAGHKKRTHRELREFDVVLTTFGTIATEQKKMEKFLLRKTHDAQATPRSDEKCLFIGPDCKWFRVIIDEAQCIKNKGTRTAKAAFQIRATSRFCLTGTPMMNSVEELYSLVHFLRIKPYSDWNKFNLDFVRPLKSGDDQSKESAMLKLQALLKAVLLRRNKQTKVNGRPILTLPERVVEVTHAVLNEDERAFYTALETQKQIEFNRYVKAGTVGKSYAQILVLLLRLRQACCHPHLIKDFGVATAADISKDEMDELCRSLSEAVIQRIKATDGVFECPVCFDAVNNPAIFVPCGHDTCSECFTRIADPMNAVANGDENGRISKCPECRGPINTKSIIDYDSFKRIHMPETLEAAEATEVDPADAETESDADSDSVDSDSESENEDDDDGEDATLGGFIVKDDVDSQASTESEAETDPDDDGSVPVITGKTLQREKDAKAMTLFKTPATASSSKALVRSKKGKGRGKGKGKGREKKKKMKKSAINMTELKRMAGQSPKHKKEYLRKLSKDYLPSAKIEKTMEIIQGVMDGADQEKIIIFSQWTSLLDLLEIEIDRRAFGYRRYDGSMNAKMRNDAVDDFKNKSRVRMMLVSLKAGNAGLNLNVASQVIILDPFWNPYIEEQAIDRAHRLGQTRPVHVHRILVEETVEDRILAIQEKKREVIGAALDEKASQSVGRLSVQELGYLFGINRDMGR